MTASFIGRAIIWKRSRFGSNVISAVATAVIVMTVMLGDVTAEDSAENTDGYLGTDSCVTCHQTQHQTYLLTSHSKSAAWLDSVGDRKTSEFQHAISARRYKIQCSDGAMVHQELLDDGSLVNTVRQDLSIGSGLHAKSYLYQDDGFWAQSPLTWYEATDQWEMSPGYDRPFHLSFRRKVRSGCVFCHVGSISNEDANPFTFEIKEVVIGCERCHGPGKNHVTFHQRQAASPNSSSGQAGEDSIVNPASLSRELSEAICQQCHLQGVAKVLVNGSDEWDFRPGTEITDVRLDYQNYKETQSTAIVGHVEQMHLSECYKQTETLTCVTCHDPHQPHSTASETVQSYRAVCINCHQDDGCNEDLQHRIDVAQDNCATCHMPAAETNVPHATFRQHKIGVYKDTAAENYRPIKLGVHPVLDLDRANVPNRKLYDSLAKASIYRQNPADTQTQSLGIEAIRHFLSVKQSAETSIEVDYTLALLAGLQGQAVISQSLASEVAEKDLSPTERRLMSLRIIAKADLAAGRSSKAVERFREIVKLNRDAQDFYYLGLAENNAGNVDAAIKALKRSVEIEPTQDAAPAALAAVFQATGKPSESQKYSAMMERNRNWRESLLKSAE